MKNFKVVSLTPDLTPEAEHVVSAPTPEAAAFLALGLDVVKLLMYGSLNSPC